MLFVLVVVVVVVVVMLVVVVVAAAAAAAVVVVVVVVVSLSLSWPDLGIDSLITDRITDPSVRNTLKTDERE